jgi:hypothetical protein
MAITRSQMKRQLYSIGGGAIKGIDAGNGREGFFRPVPGSPMANLLNTLPPRGGVFGGGPGRQLGASTGGGFGPQTGNEAIYPRIGGLRSGISSAEQELQQINQSIDQVQSTLGESSGGPQGQLVGGNSPEDNAIQAAGIMNLPLNQNPAGVTELDLRETGGFIPPVGVKEKADDIPAMLSNNEFVFTAKSVKEMGDGDVNRGAQRMYDMMKYLEKGGRV